MSRILPSFPVYPVLPFLAFFPMDSTDIDLQAEKDMDLRITSGDPFSPYV